MIDLSSRLYLAWRRVRLSRLGRAAAQGRSGRLTRARLVRHAARASTVADPSFAAEWPSLRELLTRIRRPAAGFAVDIAAGDGVTSSCTLPLFRDHCWRGLAVECDPARFALLEHAYRSFPGVRLAAVRATPATVADLLRRHDVPPDFTLLNLDIDSFDLDLLVAIIESGFRPLIIDMEVNEKVPPPVRFAVRYSPSFVWDESHFYGCSLSAAVDVLEPAGYSLVKLEYNNAFFVRTDVAEAHRIQAQAPEHAYRTGYLQRPDRLGLFPWNRDMEELLSLPPEEAVANLRRRFAARSGYLLQTHPLSGGRCCGPWSTPLSSVERTSAEPAR